MFLTITFIREGLEGRILNNLLHVHKNYPVLRQYIREIDENSGMYYLRNDEGKVMAECHYETDGNQLSFSLFKGSLKKDLQKMLTFNLVRELYEKVYISTEKMNLFYDLDNFFLIEKEGSYKIGTDDESIIVVEKYHLPLEIRNI